MAQGTQPRRADVCGTRADLMETVQQKPLPALVFAQESVEVMNMGMLWTTLPLVLESDAEPARWGYVTGVANAVGLVGGILRRI